MSARRSWRSSSLIDGPSVFGIGRLHSVPTLQVKRVRLATDRNEIESSEVSRLACHSQACLFRGDSRFSRRVIPQRQEPARLPPPQRGVETVPAEEFVV